MSNSSILSVILYNVKNLISTYKMYMTLKLDDNRCCRVHSISDDGNGWIVTNERYVVMPWKMVTRNGKNMTLAEVADSILNKKNLKLKSVREGNN